MFSNMSPFNLQKRMDDSSNGDDAPSHVSDSSDEEEGYETSQTKSDRNLPGRSRMLCEDDYVSSSEEDNGVSNFSSHHFMIAGTKRTLHAETNTPDSESNEAYIPPRSQFGTHERDTLEKVYALQTSLIYRYNNVRLFITSLIPSLYRVLSFQEPGMMVGVLVILYLIDFMLSITSLVTTVAGILLTLMTMWGLQKLIAIIRKDSGDRGKGSNSSAKRRSAGNTGDHINDLLRLQSDMQILERMFHEFSAPFHWDKLHVSVKVVFFLMAFCYIGTILRTVHLIAILFILPGVGNSIARSDFEMNWQSFGSTVDWLILLQVLFNVLLQIIHGALIPQLNYIIHHRINLSSLSSLDSHQHQCVGWHDVTLIRHPLDIHFDSLLVLHLQPSHNSCVILNINRMLGISLQQKSRKWISG
eukprot:TRINITY_DN6631_c1_g1_i1.p1 TRINITY_DN6631_c1_g1~~TRINITY_DN6631_c1_g1_i1.p1  ORF type:complete len:415 (+),score=62.79 TRINITY_DN6631_c1_g1_i1:124-1368(+)